MQNKGAIKLFAIAFALVCAFHLSFTFFSRHVENKAKKYATNQYAVNLSKKIAKGDAVRENIVYDSIVKSRERFYLDSMSNVSVYNILVYKYTYKDCKEREINLGLDLKGGMNVTMEISEVDIIKSLSGRNVNNASFLKAINLANDQFKDPKNQSDYISLFAKAYKSVEPTRPLAAIFSSSENSDQINAKSTDDEVIAVLRAETESAISRTFDILRTRIDRFGVTQPNIQRLASSGRILIELPGIKEPARVRKLLQGTANLQFWETFNYKEISGDFTAANEKLAGMVGPDGEINLESIGAVAAADTTADTINAEAKAKVIAKADTVKNTAATDTAKSKAKSTTGKADDKESFAEYAKKNPLNAYLVPNYYQKDGQYYLGEGPIVGSASIKDTARINSLIKAAGPVWKKNMKLLWTVKPDDNNPDRLSLIALRTNPKTGGASLSGDVVVDARQDYSQNNQVEISMTMNTQGARIWANLTKENVGKSVAIVLDDNVYSFPNVNEEIPNGRSSISGNFTVEEAKDLANILKAGKLPAPARIVQEEVVGPSLGNEAIKQGMISFLLAFLLVLFYMGLYYHTAGWVANFALLINVFFLFGILASLGAVLTLPGIAGIVLTFGMDVDSNVVIYERIKEEIRAGKGMRLAVSDGYKHAYSAIIDSKVTTILTGIVLYVFGSGPIQGFATTLVIGLSASLFTSIFITRLIFEYMLDKNVRIRLWYKYNEHWFTNVHINFIGIRKKLYIVSLVVILLGIGAYLLRGFSYGVDFQGGRSYVVRFDQNIHTNNVRASLLKSFGEEPEVKTFGPDNQVKITTKYLIKENDPKTDSIIDQKMYDGLKDYFKTPISFNEFSQTHEKKLIGKLSSTKVGPTVAKDIQRSAVLAVFFALFIIFAYIAIRFKKWQWGMGAVTSLFHDSIIALSIYAWLHGIVPFTLEVDQTMIAAILTIIGFSVNDTVIIFDRIREYRSLYPKRDLATNINDAINHTLGRTINTSGTVLVVLLAIIIFGGPVIRGMNFILFVGLIVGTYSSVFNATPVAYDFIMWRERIKAKKKAALQKP